MNYVYLVTMLMLVEYLGHRLSRESRPLHL